MSTPVSAGGSLRAVTAFEDAVNRSKVGLFSNSVWEHSQQGPKTTKDVLQEAGVSSTEGVDLNEMLRVLQQLGVTMTSEEEASAEALLKSRDNGQIGLKEFQLFLKNLAFTHDKIATSSR